MEPKNLEKKSNREEDEEVKYTVFKKAGNKIRFFLVENDQLRCAWQDRFALWPYIETTTMQKDKKAQRKCIFSSSFFFWIESKNGRFLNSLFPADWHLIDISQPLASTVTAY